MKKISWLLLIAMFFQIAFSPLDAFASSKGGNDISGHWAEKTISKWLNEGFVSGYKDGSFKPNGNVTRAEFVKMVNNLFHVKSAESIKTFTDLPQTHWAHDDIQAAVAAGYVGGTGPTTVSPNANITRQEAAVMLTRITKLSSSTTLAFKDTSNIASWAKDAIASLAAAKYIQHDSNTNFRPSDYLKRGEAVQLIDTVSSNYEIVFDKAGSYGNKDSLTVINGNVRITSEKVILVNTKVLGSLVVDEKVGEGDVYLQQVEVLGELIVNGGGENSIHLEDTVLVRIIVDKASGKVRLVASGATVVQQVAVQSPVKIEESLVTDTGFKNIELLPSLPAGSEVDLVGHFEDVNVMSANIQVKIPSGTVNSLNVGQNAKNNTIDIDQSVTIEKLLLDVLTKIIGEGTINKAEVAPQAQDSTFQKQPASKVITSDKATASPTPTPTPVIPPAAPPVAPPVNTNTPTPTPTPTDSNTTPTPTPTPTDSNSTHTPTPTPTDSNTTPTPTPTPTDSNTTPTPTPTPTDSNSTPTPTPTPTDSNSTPAPTPTPTDSNSTPSPTPTPTDSNTTPTPVPGAQNDASIHSLTVSHDIIPYKFTYSSTNVTSKGFSSDFLEYTIDLPHVNNTIELELDYEVAEGATVSGYLYSNSGERNRVPITIADNKISTNVNTNDFYTLELTVSSKSGIFTKHYSFVLIGNVELQRIFHIESSRYNYSSSPSYNLVANGLKDGDKVIITIPSAHSSTDQAITIERTVTPYSGSITGTYTYFSVSLDNFKPSTPTGELGLRVLRGEDILYDGSYPFDLSPITITTMPSEIATFTLQTKEQLNERNVHSNDYSLTAMYIDAVVNINAVKSLHPDATFYSIKWDSISYNMNLESNNKENRKAYFSIHGSNVSTLSPRHGFSHSFDPLRYADEPYQIDRDRLIVYYLYNQDFEVIAAYEKIITLTDEYVADNVVIKPKVISAEEMANVLPKLNALDINQNLVIQDNTYNPIEFDPNITNYYVQYSENLDGQKVTLNLGVDNGLNVSAYLTATYNFDYESKILNVSPSNSISFDIKKGTSYTLYLTVTHPYTNESKSYNIRFDYVREAPEVAHLSSQSLYVYGLKKDDIVEIKFPSHITSKNEDITGIQTIYNVNSDYYYESIGLFYFFDEEGNMISLDHLGKTGELEVAFIRDNEIIGEETLYFDFGPVNRIEGGSFDIVNAQQPDESASALIKFNFSDIPNAFYLSHNDYVSNPTIQDALHPDFYGVIGDNVSFTIYLYSDEIDGKKYMLRNHTFGFYLYDANKNFIGYKEFNVTLTEDHVADDIILVDSIPYD